MKFNITHQTGRKDLKQVQMAYEQYGIDATVESFLDNMQFHYTHTDLLICRAGATTCAEITALGILSIMIPYPYATNNHQLYNALELQKKNATILIEQKRLTTTFLFDTLYNLISFPKKAKEISKNALALGKPNACFTVAKAALNLFK